MFVLFGWAIILGMVYLVSVTEVSAPQAALFDPYVILDLPTSASEKEIKSQYRQYTLKYHPDKVRDLEGNMTRDDVESRFVDITKAYKALTDAEVRENYVKYGHPDGPQQTSHGIALPKFLVDSTGSPIVIALYSIFFAVILPYFVGRWWGAIQMYTKSGIHRETAGAFFETLVKDQPQFITHQRILEILSDAEEYKTLLPKSTPKKNLELIKQHLNREPAKDTSEEAVRLTVVARAPTILDGFLDIASGFKNLQLSHRILDIRRAIVQAVSLEVDFLGAELLQLPGANQEAVFASTLRKIDQIVEVSSDKKAQEILGTVDLETAHDAIETAKHLPKLHIVDISFKTPGEDVVPPKARVFVVVRYVITAPGVKLPKLPVYTLSDEEAMSLIRNPTLANNSGSKYPQTSAPYFPLDQNPSWSLFILGANQAIIEGPVDISRGLVTKTSDVEEYKKQEALFKKENKDDDEEFYSDLIKINTLKLPFPSPSPESLGTFPISFSIVSKDYFGLDVTLEAPLIVENPKEEEIVSDDVYDIPDPDEDSLAGALASVQGRPVKPASSEDSDEEEEEDLSDIDTDTEAEFSSDEEDEEEEEKKTK